MFAFELWKFPAKIWLISATNASRFSSRIDGFGAHDQPRLCGSKEKQKPFFAFAERVLLIAPFRLPHLLQLIMITFDSDETAKSTETAEKMLMDRLELRPKKCKSLPSEKNGEQ